MTTRIHIPALLAGFAICGALVAGCGDDGEGDPIPNGKAAALRQQLDTAEQEIQDGLCDEAFATIDDARSTADTLDDDGVGSDVQDALGDGIDNLRALAVLECDEEEEVETTPETVPEPLPPPPTETTAPPTETTPPPPTETTPPPTTEDEEEPPADEGDGGAQFDPDEIPPGQQKKLDGEGDD